MGRFNEKNREISQGSGQGHLLTPKRGRKRSENSPHYSSALPGGKYAAVNTRKPGNSLGSRRKPSLLEYSNRSNVARQSKVEQVFSLDEQDSRVTISFSIGIHRVNFVRDNLTHALLQADHALYTAT
jgi:hypothetical protein